MSAGPHDFLDPPQQEGEIGRLPGYRVLGLLQDGPVLWEGPMFLYFRAEDLRLHRPVVLKILNPAVSSESSAAMRFLRGFRAMAAVCHDNVVNLHAVDIAKGICYGVLEDLDGEMLEQRLERESYLPVPDVVQIGRDIAKGLSAVHRQGIIHRNIQPGNIWLQTNPEIAKILDFSLARAADEAALSVPSGVIVGTPAYMSPEQAGGEPIDYRSDLFSLGCLLYHLATGRPPFKRASVIATLRAVAAEEPVPPQQHNPAVPGAVNDIILRLLVKKPTDRPGSATAVAEELERLLNSG
jgi:serine/threonine protein kinase